MELQEMAPAAAAAPRAVPVAPAEIVVRRRDEAEVLVAPNTSIVYAFVKRALDVVVALVGLVLALPIMAAIACVIRLESPGPAVFRQRRVGRDGHEFTFYKFRTMYADAKDRFPELYDYQYDEADVASMYYKPAIDPRNTHIGRIVRKTTLDELPNLFNVLKGDVSLVGPRPELPEMVRYYKPHQIAKFSVKSGITGLAQVSGRNRLTVQEQINLDVEYVARQSLCFDLQILGRTVSAVIRQIGAE